jgi:hypothetical protein
MNVVGLDVQFWREYPFLDIVAVLQSHGWQFYGGNVVYLPLLQGEEMEEDWNWKVASTERWLEIKQEIKLKQSLKETVGIKLEWIEKECVITMTLDAAQHLGYHVISLYPHLTDSKIADFTWFLIHLVLPLEKSEYKIQLIECSQDRS